MSNVKLDIPWNKLFIDLFDGLLISKHHFSGGLKDENKWIINGKEYKFIGSDKKSEKEKNNYSILQSVPVF